MFSIRWKLIVSYVLLSTVTALLVGLISYFLIKGYVNKQADEQLQLTAESIEEQLRPLFKDPEADKMRTTAQLLGILNQLRIRVLDGREHLITDTHPGGMASIRRREVPGQISALISRLDETTVRRSPAMAPGRTMFLDEDAIAERALQRAPTVATVTVESQNSDTLEGRVLMLPVRENGGLLGFIELQHPPDLADDVLTRSKLFLLLAGLAAVAAAVCIGMVTGKRLTSPLTSLNTAVRRIEAGHLSVRADVHRNDEIGELAASVNRMAHTIEANIDSLRSERDALKSFAQDASHELKTPVTALRTFNELLLGRSGNDPESRREFLNDSRIQLKRLQWIVEALLNLTRLDADVVELARDNIDVNQIILEAVNGRRGVVDEKQIDIRADVTGKHHVVGDRNYLSMAVGNIVDNALKYTGRGSRVTVTTSAVEGVCRISVSDEGPGISHTDLPNIFKRFYRSRQATGDGSGLGLSLADSIVRAHGGRIEVETSEGSGSTFTIILPA